MNEEEIYEQMRKLREIAESDRRVVAVAVRKMDEEKKPFIYIYPKEVDMGETEEILA